MSDESTVEPKWEYGFYDDDPNGLYMHSDEDPPAQEHPTIYWYTFGILKHESPSSAMHTANKSCWGMPIIVRRTPEQRMAREAGGPDEYEVYEGAMHW